MIKTLNFVYSMLKKSNFSKISFIVLLSILIIGCASIEDKKQFFFQKGQIFFQKNEYAKANMCFRNAVKIDSEFGMAYGKIGECEIRLNRWKKAIPYFRKAVQFSPEFKEDWLLLAELLILEKKIDEAKDIISVAVKKFPNSKRGLLLTGIISILENKIDKADEIFKHVIEIKTLDRSKSYITIAQLLGNKDDRYKDAELIEQLFLRNEKIPLTLLALVSVCLVERNTFDRENIYEKLIQFYPTNKTAIDSFTNLSLDFKQPKPTDMSEANKLNIKNSRSGSSLKGDSSLPPIKFSKIADDKKMEIQKKWFEMTEIIMIIVGSFMFLIIIFGRKGVDISS